MIKDMEQSPFIVWTFRRSGGTNLAHKLITLSKFDTVEHEPFNVDRVFKDITKAWIDTKDKVQLERDLRKILSKKINFKHCLEIIPQDLNQMLAILSLEYGYKHLFLYRENATSRMLSLQFSKDTGIWGQKHTKGKSTDVSNKKIPIEKLIQHECSSRRMLEGIYDTLQKKSPNNVVSISFESVFKSNEFQAKILIIELFSALNNMNIKLSDDILDELLKKGNQGTSNLYSSYRNYHSFIEAASKLSDFNLAIKQRYRTIEDESYFIKMEYFPSIYAFKNHIYIDLCNTEDIEPIDIKSANENIKFISHNESGTVFSTSPIDSNIRLKLPVMKEDLLVSVVIPVYNVSQYINRCLDSIVEQSYQNLQIIIVDDRGQDDSIDKVKKYLDNRITIVEHEKNKGLAGARNTGINHATGDFILFLDSDDYVEKDLIEKCIHEQARDDVDAVVFSSQHIDDEEVLFPVDWMEKYSGESRSNVTIDNEEAHNIVAWDVAAWSKLIRLDFIKKNGIYFQEEQRYFEDHYFSAKMYSLKASFSYIDEKLHYYYRRSDVENKSITQITSPLVSLYRSRMMREVSLLLDDINSEYKNIFYPVYFSLYKQVFFESFELVEYRKEVYNNLNIAFQCINELDMIKEAELWEVDLAFLISNNDYNDYVNKFNPIWKFSEEHLKQVMPEELHYKLSDYEPLGMPVLKPGPNFILSGVIMLMLCIFNLKFLSKKNFAIKLRDFHIIRRLGVVNTNGKLRNQVIFDYIMNGEKNGEVINSKFEAKKYLEMNPSLSKMNMGLYSHFLFYGRPQKRNCEGLE
ncbi:glycosyltransferase [Vibrio sp. 1CM2L]|uniref:glycosyltransferase family 2 protein n=1 Tax=Vibrio sp. 1CM2L TaxID=2929166 RepID=UPI0020BFB89F|nr:glycosyltransferase family 2 protein [Vibrio sp. 1CM2L]MCK8078690.1 glycosyltransferase [Vibrio sp. 1CM2L]